MTRETAAAFRTALEVEIRTLMVRERSNHNLVRLRVEQWRPGLGGWVLTPSWANPNLNGARIIQLTDRVNINGQRFQARWNTDMPRHPTLVARFSGGGNPTELIEDPFLGLVATNEWDEDPQGQVRFVSAQQESNSTYRLVRFEATEAIVNLIQ